jgi:uncharacterized protein
MTVDFSLTQQAFTRYIRNPAANPIPVDVKPERMAMYRELIFNNINGFLEGNFPVIRVILTDDEWHALVQDFFIVHRSKTPYFAEIAEEFLDYLENERNNPNDLPILLELAHYEWVEMALSIADEDVYINTNYDVSPEQQVKLSPLAWPLVYSFPVHLISPDYLPIQPLEQPTCLIVYRDNKDAVNFIEINAITYRLLEIIQSEDSINIGQCLAKIAQESLNVNSELIMKGGLQVIKELIQKSILLTCFSSDPQHG